MSRRAAQRSGLVKSQGKRGDGQRFDVAKVTSVRKHDLYARIGDHGAKSFAGVERIERNVRTSRLEHAKKRHDQL